MVSREQIKLGIDGPALTNCCTAKIFMQTLWTSGSGNQQILTFVSFVQLIDGILNLLVSVESLAAWRLEQILHRRKIPVDSEYGANQFLTSVSIASAAREWRRFERR